MKESASLIRFEAVESETLGQPTAILAQARKQLTGARRFAHCEGATARDLDLDVITLLQAERLDNRGGQSNRKAITPPGYLHRRAPLIYMSKKYIHNNSPWPCSAGFTPARPRDTHAGPLLQYCKRM